MIFQVSSNPANGTRFSMSRFGGGFKEDFQGRPKGQHSFLGCFHLLKNVFFLVGFEGNLSLLFFYYYIFPRV